MEPKKDFSTAILDSKKAPNKLIVPTFLIISGLRGFERWKFIYPTIASQDGRTQNLQGRRSLHQGKKEKINFSRCLGR